MIAAGALGCALAAGPALAQAGVARAEQGVTAERLLQHVRVLASDRFGGRGPGTFGEDSTVAYLADQLRRMGLQPGNAGSFFQTVPLVGTISQVTASVAVRGQRQELRQPDDYVAWSMRPNAEVRVDDSELVFVGYGVVAPEFGWDDFKGVDVRGKTVVMLVGDPPIPDPRDPARLDPRVFRGPAMTYYGRWTYKYETAAARGAAACIIVHQTGPAGYAWGVVASNTGRERFDIQGAGAQHIPVEGWIQLDVAKRLFSAAGQDFDALERAAATRAFRPVSLGATASFVVRNAVREVRSRNVVARLDGRDPAARSQYVLYTAHWDHFGIGRTINGDSIYNGALDNAAGLAWLLETARAYRALPTAPRRSIVFLAVTAEEQGLLGARWYAAHPIYPLARTLADINMDIPNPWGRTRSIVSVSHGQTTLEGILAREAARVGRRVVPDPEPEKGYFYRSDHFELSRQGVPALAFLFPGTDYIGRPADYGTRVRANYVANDYHKPTDEVKPDWDLAGMVDDTRLLFRVGIDVANGTTWPQWNPGTEFRAARERMLHPRNCGNCD
ncbi:MAG TPA: M28 family peptidase [Longimicrobium sp.]